MAVTKTKNLTRFKIIKLVVNLRKNFAFHPKFIFIDKIKILIK